MRYLIHEVELSTPLRDVRVPAAHTGVALVARWQRRPVAFLMLPAREGTLLGAERLAELLGRESAERILRAQLLAELRRQPMSRARSVTVAICTRNRPQQLERCLSSILALPEQHRRDARLDVLVVDNAPPDDRTRRVVEALSGVRYALEPRPGLNFARNRALQEATGEVVAYLDDDVSVDAGWLAGLQEAWHENSDAAACTGLVLPYELDTAAQVLFEHRGGFRRGFDKLRYTTAPIEDNPCYPCGAGMFGAGCNMAFETETLRRLGGFDEALDTGPPLPGGGDLDIFYRVIRAGHPLVYEPRALVFHEHRRELAELKRQYWTWGLGLMAFVEKSYASEPGERGKFRHLVRWWFANQARETVKSLLGRSVVPPDYLLAEMAGAAAGLAGGYRRSRRRTEAIRAAH